MAYELDKERFVRRGKARIKAAFAAQPFRGSPSWDDLHTLGEAILCHLVADHGEVDEDDLSSSEVETLASTELPGLTAEQIAGLGSTEVATLDPATQLGELTSTELGALGTTELPGLTTEELASLNTGAAYSGAD